jgi:hypothetical protein
MKLCYVSDALVLWLMMLNYMLQTYQLLNSDEHANFLLRNNKNPGDYIPDICHQVGSKMFLSVIFSHYFLLLSLMFMLCFLVGFKMVGLKMIKFCFVLCLNVLTCSTFREYTMMVLNFVVIIWLKCDFSFQSTIIFAFRTPIFCRIYENVSILIP